MSNGNEQLTNRARVSQSRLSSLSSTDFPSVEQTDGNKQNAIFRDLHTASYNSSTWHKEGKAVRH